MSKVALVDELVQALDQWRKATPKGWDDTMEIGTVLHAEYCRDTVRNLLVSLFEAEKAAVILRQVVAVLHAEEFDAYEPESIFRGLGVIHDLVPVEFYPEETQG